MQSNEISKRLTEAKLRVTIKRIQVMQLFVDSPGWEGSIEQIFRALFDKGIPVTITDIYRIVRSFEDHGLVSKSYTAGRLVPVSVYSLSADSAHRPQQQHRLTCRVCRTSIEFNDEPLRLELERASEQHGFAMEQSIQSSLMGMCRKCVDLAKDISYRGMDSHDTNAARSRARKRRALDMPPPTSVAGR